jgi:tetrapyrrole methylase family protein/MazG family protein
VNVARWEHIDAEEALAAANRKFRRRWALMENMAREEGVRLEDVGVERLNCMWDAAKARERSGGEASGDAAEASGK